MDKHTPRTNKAASGLARLLIDRETGQWTELVAADFARQLERELNLQTSPTMLTTTQAAKVLDLSPKGLAMTAKERAERARLHRLWATGKATRKQMLRCMDLDRKAEASPRDVGAALAALDSNPRTRNDGPDREAAKLNAFMRLFHADHDAGR